jgi:hypothetical protein
VRCRFVAIISGCALHALDGYNVRIIGNRVTQRRQAANLPPTIGEVSERPKVARGRRNRLITGKLVITR